ncbi:exodeoxyribonuclease V subunit alpha [Limnohabitans sp. T6-5]|uniref:exodeoxyribonuclease V subunit alpha n=1 Tax=Limnohabitans sp. T6-5 TaxID=1100724 RepID=UPI000D378B39|nr:exodeoxyribonuclease V subunit alpha [Limnohabitans sp. T6-5]PUE10822.1 exodeoxyribonuclease V subunit alpha [Limnohabitans sp. T6-5]
MSLPKTGRNSVSHSQASAYKAAQMAAQMDWLQDVPATGLSVSQTLAWLHAWSELGWLRRLDSALAEQLHRVQADVPPAVLVAAAVLAQMEGRGHTCLSVNELLTPPTALLAWPTEAVHSPQGLLALWAHLPADRAGWLATLRAAPACLREASAPDAGQALVLGGTADAPLLYWRRYRAYEERVGQTLLQRAQSAVPVPHALARQWLDRFFVSAARTGDAPEDETDWQKLACAVALRARLSVITGGPGTGKTYTAARLLALLLALHDGASPLRVALAAPTGKAAARLKQSIDGSLQALKAQAAGQEGASLDLDTLIQRIGAARTLHSLLGARPDTRQFQYNAAHQLDVDVLIVDEASMVHLEMMDALLQALPPTARLVLLGDKDQLASVEAGAVLGDVCRDAAQGGYTPETLRFAQEVAGQTLAACFHASAASEVSALAQQTVMLRKSRRFDGPIGQLALAVNEGDAAKVQQAFALPGHALTALQPSSAQAVSDLAAHASGGASYADYLQCVNSPPASGDVAAHAAWVKQVLKSFDRFRILCAVHQGDWGTAALNAAVQKALADAGWLQPQGEWFTGRPVMVTRNDTQLGVFNGDVGVVLPNLQKVPKAWFLDGEQLRSVSVSRLAHAETAFIMTVHKSQGSEFEHTALVLPPGAAEVLSRELVYTGITRARDKFTLIEAQEGLLQAAIARPSVRVSGLRQWWGGAGQ